MGEGLCILHSASEVFWLIIFILLVGIPSIPRGILGKCESTKLILVEIQREHGGRGGGKQRGLWGMNG